MDTTQVMAPVVAEGAQGDRIRFGDTEIVFKCPAAGSEEGWTALDYTLAPRQGGAPLHYHRELLESFFVISGELWMKVGEREMNANPGTYAFVPPGVPHSFANRSEAPARFLVQASGPQHKQFLLELIRLAERERGWPPKDPREMLRLGELFDTVYVPYL
jgi:mannose-6-phosphate isomerase-like protein (cupin superfamily)